MRDAVTLRALRDLPGLGPIRIRALEKAGFRSLSLLRAATLQQLLAVPGMSDPKARHIQTVLANAILAEAGVSGETPDSRGVAPADAYNPPNNSAHDFAANSSAQPLSNHSNNPSDGFEAALPRKAARLLKADEDRKRGTPTHEPVTFETRSRNESGEAPIPAASPTGASLWEREAERARQDIVALLTCPPAPNFRARLLRELVRFAAGMPLWKAALAQAGDKDQERALRRLRRLQDSLMETRVQQDIDRKTQARLAEDLAEASDRLYALSGQPEPARRTEDTHD